jgi:pyruvate formate lyase activating enzyme
MPFYKITHHAERRFATLHNFGCTFRCSVCSYKLRSGADGIPGQSFPRPDRFLTVEEMKTALRQVKIEQLFVMGGEPTIARELPEMLAFAKNELGVKTFLGHTNGSKLPLPNLDGANVGLKAWDAGLHRAYTGRDKDAIFNNFAAAFRQGLEMKANVVFIPGYVDLDQVEAVAEWLAKLSPDIPFHIMGYIPVPGQPYAQPTVEQMRQAEAVSRKHLAKVDSSHLDPKQATDLASRDNRFAVTRIA